MIWRASSRLTDSREALTFMDQLDIIRYFAALIIVLGLLGGFAVIARRAGWTGSLPGLDRFIQSPVERRLAISESLILDPRRRVVIVRSDDHEHVLLLGPERETLLETRPAKPEPVFEPVLPASEDAETNEDAPHESPATPISVVGGQS